MQDKTFKVGDRVQITPKAIGPGGDYSGHTGTVTSVTENGNYRVTIDSPGAGTFIYWSTELIPAPTPTTPTLQPGEYAATVHPNGTVTLTPAQAAEKVEEKPKESEQGEIWRRERFGDLLLRTDSGSDMRWVSVSDKEDGAGYVWVIDPDDVTFAYPSLAAAVAAGAIK